MTKKSLTHFDERGRARMVDVGHKEPTARMARAEGYLKVARSTVALVRDEQLPKGNPTEVARLAGIQAAKRTFELIPLCHNVALSSVDVQIALEDDGFKIESRVGCTGPTGVEMEALTAVSIAALTLYDMCKAVDKKMRIEGIRLVEKTK
jgi:cyclic pyranopterin monophosphate synthase